MSIKEEVMTTENKMSEDILIKMLTFLSDTFRNRKLILNILKIFLTNIIIVK